MDGKQLKNSILQWAIQGKLVPQNPKDEPAQKLLERVEKERNAKIKSGEIKLTKPEKNIKKNFPECDIPQGWCWCQLVDICRAFGRIGFRGYTKEDLVTDSTQGALSISPSNMKDYGMEYNVCTYISWKKYEESPEIKIENGDLLIVKTGSSYGKAVLVENLPCKATINPQIAVIKDVCIEKKYLLYFLQSPFAREKYEDFVLGTSIPTFSQANLLSIGLALPPLAEQKRIVAKLEQVLPLAEEYGAAQEQLDKLNKELPEALKKSILQEAIQGKLVPQNPKDEPAQKLLERIAASRNENSLRLSKGTSSTSLRGAKATKQSKNPPSRIYRENGVWYEQIDTATPKDITDEIPFEIPETWTWCRLDNLGTFVRGNGIKRDETVSTGKPCVRYGEMYTTYRVKFSDIKSHTTSNIFDKCQKFHKDDILMALTGENKWDIALAAVYQGDEEVALGGDMCRFSPFESNSLYLVYLINSPYGIGYKRETSTGDIIVHTSVGKLGNFLVPLPPLAEQKRIVVKLEQLFKVL